MRYFWPMTVSGGMPTALDMVLVRGAGGLASRRGPRRLCFCLRRSGASVVSGPSAVRARRRAGVLPSPLEPLQRRRCGVSAAKLLAVGAGEGFVGVVAGRSGPRRRRSWPRVKAARTRLPGWELAVGIGGIGERLQRSSSARRGPGAAVDGRPRAPGAAATGTLGPARPPPTSPSTLPAPG